MKLLKAKKKQRQLAFRDKASSETKVSTDSPMTLFETSLIQANILILTLSVAAPKLMERLTSLTYNNWKKTSNSIMNSRRST